MNFNQYNKAFKAIPKEKQETHKDAIIHLIAFHTGNTPAAIKHSFKSKDGFAEGKVAKIHPNTMSEIYKSSLTHGNLKGGK